MLSQKILTGLKHDLMGFSLSEGACCCVCCSFKISFLQDVALNKTKAKHIVANLIQFILLDNWIIG
jgi:hypothetical protein